MADNVPITAGTGTNIATDDVSGVHYQKTKLDVGGDGVSVPVVGSLPTSHVQSDLTTVTWDAATAQDTVLALDVTKYGSVSLYIATSAGTLTGGFLEFEASNDGGTSWVGCSGVGSWGHDEYGQGTGVTSAIDDRNLAEMGTSLRDLIVFAVGGYTNFRVRLINAITGTATVTLKLRGDTAANGMLGTHLALPLLVAGEADNDVTHSLRVDDNGRLHAVHSLTWAPPAASWTSATTLNTALTIDVRPFATVSLQLARDAGTVTGGAVVFEGTVDGGTTWVAIGGRRSNGAAPSTSLDTTVTLSDIAANTAHVYLLSVAGFMDVRVRLNPVITGTATIAVALLASTAPSPLTERPPGSATYPAYLAELPPLSASTANIGDVDVLTVPAPLSTTGGGTEASALRVTIANDSTGVVSVDDNGASLTVDGTVAVSSLPALPAGSNKIGAVDLDSDAAPGSAVPATAQYVAGTDGTNARGLKTDAAGELQVDVLTLPALPAGSNKIGAVDLDSDATPGDPVPGTGQYVMGTDGTNARGLKTDTAGELQVDVLTLPALVAGTANIGDVDVLTVPAPLSTTGGGTEAAALRVTLANDSTGLVSVDDNGGSLTVDGTVSVNLNAGTNTNEVVGDAAHDDAAAGNPLLGAGVAIDTDDTAPPNRVSAEGDVVRLGTDRDGSQFVRPHGPQIWSYHENSSAALTDATVHAAPGAGLSLYVCTIVVSTGAATAFNIFFEEGSTTVLGPYYLEAVAGRGLALQFNPPKKITANTALTATTSAAIAHSIDITGYTAQG